MSSNLFQKFSQIFIESQESFNYLDSSLRNKCRRLSGLLNNIAESMEEDPFLANLESLEHIEEDINSLCKIYKELEEKRELIKNSVDMLDKSAKIRAKRL
jgi:hypothetical protein